MMWGWRGAQGWQDQASWGTKTGMLAWGYGRKDTRILRWDGRGTSTRMLVGQQCCWSGAGVMTKTGILERSGG